MHESKGSLAHSPQGTSNVEAQRSRGVGRRACVRTVFCVFWQGGHKVEVACELAGWR